MKAVLHFDTAVSFYATLEILRDLKHMHLFWRRNMHGHTMRQLLKAAGLRCNVSIVLAPRSFLLTCVLLEYAVMYVIRHALVKQSTQCPTPV